MSTPSTPDPTVDGEIRGLLSALADRASEENPVTARLVPTSVKERSFRFSSGSDRAEVTCLNCGWVRHPGWADYQRVFDLSRDHECAGVETYQHMRDRLAAERRAEMEARNA